MYALVVAILLLLSSLSHSDVHHHLTFNYFPEFVPIFHVRNDIHTKQPVSRGHVPPHLLHARNYTHSTTPKMGYHQMRKHFQCAPDEPGVNGNNGAISLLRYIPPTQDILEVMCAWAETRCEPWTRCQDLRYAFKQGKFPQEFGMHSFDGFSSFHLIRIANGKVHWGWPWGYTRSEPFSIGPNSLMLFDIVDSLKDLPDLVTFIGGERSFLPMNFPFPAISNAPRMGYNQIPWPFYEGYRDEKILAKKALQQGLDLKNDSNVNQLMQQTPWNEKIAKAAFYARFDESRHLIFDIARARPDLVDVSTVFEVAVKPLHPMSVERPLQRSDVDVNKTDDEPLPFGYVKPLFKLPIKKEYNATDYKYVVVPQGTAALSSSGRIFSILARSRSVVILVGGITSSHITARLQPWVHYVPLSQSGAELAEIVEWLQAHDDLAKQIAENGYNFGRSYLRLEDYYCYGASVLYAIGMVERNTTVLAPFDMEEVTLVSGDMETYGV